MKLARCLRSGIYDDCTPNTIKKLKALLLKLEIYREIEMIDFCALFQVFEDAWCLANEKCTDFLPCIEEVAGLRQYVDQQLMRKHTAPFGCFSFSCKRRSL